MPRLSRAQERARRQIFRLADLTLLPAELADRLLAPIAEAIPADGQLFCGIDPATLLFNRILAVSGTMVGHLPPFLRDLYLREPFPGITHPRLMGAGLTALVLHEQSQTSWGLPPQALGAIGADDYLRAYRAASGPRGGLLRAFYRDAGQWLVALELVRYAPEWPFRRGELAFARLIAPVIGAAFRAALARERMERNDDAKHGGLPPSGIVLLTPDGQVSMRTSAADWWLDRLRTAEGRSVTALPTALWAAVAGLKAPQAGTVSRLRAPTSAGTLLVEATPGGDDGTIAIVLLPPQPIAVSDALSLWPLTRQERHVVDLSLRGWSNQQIAAALSVSDHTVASHLRHAFAKLDVRGRTGLLTRFVAELHDTASAGL